MATYTIVVTYTPGDLTSATVPDAPVATTATTGGGVAISSMTAAQAEKLAVMLRKTHAILQASGKASAGAADTSVQS